MIRTGYSFKVAVGSLADVLSRVKELGWPAAPIADQTSTFGFVRFTKKCQDLGLRPVYGVRLNVTPDPAAKKPVYDAWTFLAVDSLRPLHDAVYAATQRKAPALTYAEAVAMPGVVRIAGPRVLLDHAAGGDFRVGLSPALPAATYRAARRRGLEFVAMSDNYYPRETDRELYRIAVRFSSIQTYPTHILSDDEWRRSVAWFADAADQDAALALRDAIIDGSRAVLRQATLFSPEKHATLRELCVAGAARLGVDLASDVYSERLDREIRLIEEKQFSDYFHLLSDVINWARDRMIVGPARGSSCGSLVCYLLGITTVDPIPFDLVFERFIDTTRSDLPDVDVDFSDKHRHLVFEELERRYGRDSVARLGNVNTFQGRSALNLVAAELKVPFNMVDDVTNVLFKRSKGDSRADSKLGDTLVETEAGQRMLRAYPEMKIVDRLEGHPAAASQHAAGVVLTATPVRDFVAVDARTGSAMCDKYDAEALNLLKIDALGLTQLSTFERVLELIGERPVSGWFERLPLDDKAALDILNNQHYSGIFQFMPGSALAAITTDLCQMRPGSITSFEDIVSLIALVRPGPLSSGGTRTWMERKTGKKEVTYFHPVFEPYLRDTLGIAIYQEQVMRIGREVGGLSWDDVNALRRAMSKSLGTEFFSRYGDPWKATAVAKGIPREAAEAMWDHMCSFGAMGFNRAHAVSYGMVTYWACWLKAHHPVEFAAASLDAEADPAKQVSLLRELRAEGVDYVAIDPDRSTERWEIAPRPGGGRRLVGPLSNVQGIGPVKMAAILGARRTGKPLPAGLRRLLAAPRTAIDSLTPVADALSRIDMRSHNIDVRWRLPISRAVVGVATDVILIGVVRAANPKDLNDLTQIAKRGGRRIEGKANTLVLNLSLRDDDDEIHCHVGMDRYLSIGQKIIERGDIGTVIYAMSGRVLDRFRMFDVKKVRCLGTLDNPTVRGDMMTEFLAREKERNAYWTARRRSVA